ncbi:MAG: hypothetical protein VW169_12305, partial [Rhodospirillaceae bacterium]
PVPDIRHSAQFHANGSGREVLTGQVTSPVLTGLEQRIPGWIEVIPAYGLGQVQALEMTGNKIYAG